MYHYLSNKNISQMTQNLWSDYNLWNFFLINNTFSSIQIGQICQTNINECASQPCQNGATCYDTINGYSCYCPPGYNGLFCEIQTNDCSSSPCVTGQCVTLRPFGFTCVCPPGRTGVQCEIRINECASNPCKNNGMS